jgi:hypothetical protein
VEVVWLKKLLMERERKLLHALQLTLEALALPHLAERSVSSSHLCEKVKAHESEQSWSRDNNSLLSLLLETHSNIAYVC